MTGCGWLRKDVVGDVETEQLQVPPLPLVGRNDTSKLGVHAGYVAELAGDDF